MLYSCSCSFYLGHEIYGSLGVDQDNGYFKVLPQEVTVVEMMSPKNIEFPYIGTVHEIFINQELQDKYI